MIVLSLRVQEDKATWRGGAPSTRPLSSLPQGHSHTSNPHHPHILFSIQSLNWKSPCVGGKNVRIGIPDTKLWRIRPDSRDTDNISVADLLSHLWVSGSGSGSAFRMWIFPLSGIFFFIFLNKGIRIRIGFVFIFARSDPKMYVDHQPWSTEYWTVTVPLTLNLLSMGNFRRRGFWSWKLRFAFWWRIWRPSDRIRSRYGKVWNYF